MQNNPTNPFLVKSAKFFEDNHEKLLIVKLSHLMPWLTPFLALIARTQLFILMGLRLVVPRFMNRFEELPGFWIINQVRNVINERIEKKTSSLTRLDLLQLMLNAVHSDHVKVDRRLRCVIIN